MLHLYISSAARSYSSITDNHPKPQITLSYMTLQTQRHILHSMLDDVFLKLLINMKYSTVLFHVS